MPRRKSWSDDQLTDAYNKHNSIRAISRELGLYGTNNFNWLKRHLHRVGLITDPQKHFYRWDEAELVEAVRTSHSMKEVCKKVRVAPYDKRVRAKIKELALDRSHFFLLKDDPKNLFKKYEHNEITPKMLQSVHEKCLRVGNKLGYLGKKCKICGKYEKRLFLKHLDMDTYNNLPQNVVVVCQECK